MKGTGERVPFLRGLVRDLVEDRLPPFLTDIGQNLRPDLCTDVLGGCCQFRITQRNDRCTVVGLSYSPTLGQFPA